MNAIQIERERITYRGKLIEVVEQDVSVSGQQKVFELARRGPGTRLIFDSGDRILLTTEYRHELDRYDLRLPGGKVFDTLPQYEEFLRTGGPEVSVAQEAACREAAEEVGLKPLKVRHLATSVCGATVQWDLHYFAVSRWDELPQGQQLEAGEDISASWYAKRDVVEAALNGRISEERSALQLLRYLRDFEA
ncbi:NUDIX domain-containing protein [Streptomyces nigra]|uniref:NUDIX domain-containing protein n=1 Tax=Streptomyces nigra TaxID=1827580 RepID=UPI0037F3B9CD